MGSRSCTLAPGDAVPKCLDSAGELLSSVFLGVCVCVWLRVQVFKGGRGVGYDLAPRHVGSGIVGFFSSESVGWVL